MFTNKKVLVLATTDNMIWQFLIPHIQDMQKAGNVVECACNKSGFWFDELKEKYGFTMHEIHSARNPVSPKNIKAYKELKQLVKQNGYNLIYCQQPVGGLFGRLLAKKFKIPCIYTAHGFHFFKGAPLKNNLIFKPVEKYLAKYTDILITINEEDYQAAKKMKAKKVFKIHGIGFDENKYEPLTQTKEEIKKEFNVENKFVVVTVAECIPRKNYDTMLNTIQKFKGENLHWFIVGTGKQKDEIQKRIQHMQMESQITMLGYRKDINKILTMADCFFLASLQEGLTLAIIEAMRFGLPVITSNVRGNRDLIEHEKGGFVCSAKDDVSFAKALQTLMQNSNLCAEFGAYNIQQSKKYMLENINKELNEIYKEI